MYLLLGILNVIVGICLVVFANPMTKKSIVVTGIKIVGIALIAVGLSMTYLLFTGKVVLPLSNN